MAIVRIVILVVLCAVLLTQGQRSRGMRYRPWSMWFGAAAFGALAVGNMVGLFGVTMADYAIVAVGIPVLLMVVSVVLLALSWYAQERQPQLRAARRTLADEIKRRSSDTDS